MREIGIVLSIILAVIAGVYGWLAASAWGKASKVEIKHHFGMESPEIEWAHDSKIAATMIAVSESAIPNQKAAALTSGRSGSAPLPAYLAL